MDIEVNLTWAEVLVAANVGIMEERAKPETRTQQYGRSGQRVGGA